MQVKDITARGKRKITCSSCRPVPKLAQSSITVKEITVWTPPTLAAWAASHISTSLLPAPWLVPALPTLADPALIHFPGSQEIGKLGLWREWWRREKIELRGGWGPGNRRWGQGPRAEVVREAEKGDHPSLKFSSTTRNAVNFYPPCESIFHLTSVSIISPPYFSSHPKSRFLNSFCKCPGAWPPPGFCLSPLEMTMTMPSPRGKY